MGYCIEQTESQFRLASEHHDAALRAIQGLVGSETISDTSGRHFSWVRSGFERIDNLEEMLKEWRWEPAYLDGDIVGLRFFGEKSGDDGAMLNAIAPFVDAGSYVQMQGEDGAVWRWYFNGDTCETQAGVVVFSRG